MENISSVSYSIFPAFSKESKPHRDCQQYYSKVYKFVQLIFFLENKSIKRVYFTVFCFCFQMLVPQAVIDNNYFMPTHNMFTIYSERCVIYLSIYLIHLSIYTWQRWATNLQRLGSAIIQKTYQSDCSF